MKGQQDRENKLWRRYNRVYHLVTPVIGAIVRSKFNYSYDSSGADLIDGPVLLVPNHSNAWDPLLVCSAFRRKPMYFVASEHILRWRVAGPLIKFLAQPIPRRKASMGTGTVKACIRHLKAGRSVALFAEGEQTWNGVSGRVFPATGKLVRQSNATLVTYRLEGAYLAKPRWADSLRKGRIFGHTVNVYTPEVLKGMTADQINEAINRDIYFDVWKWQEEQPGGGEIYKTKGNAGLAEGIDRALYMCPSCGKIGHLTAAGDSVSCSCGFSARYSENGILDNMPLGFRTLADWDRWQEGELKNLAENAVSGSLSQAGSDEDRILFSDTEAELLRVEDGHTDTFLTSGELGLHVKCGRLTLLLGDRSFALEDISMMAMVLSHTLLFQTGDGYFQIHARDINLRKYLQVWQYQHSNNMAQKG